MLCLVGRSSRPSAAAGLRSACLPQRHSLRHHQSTSTTVRSSKPSTTPPSGQRQKATLASNGSSPFVAGTRWSISEAMEEFLRKPRTIPIPRWITPKHSTISGAECFGHASFILVALSYSVNDFLMLRIIAVAGSTAMLFFSYFHPHGRVLWLPFKWNVLFIAINSYRIGRVYLDHFYSKQLPAEWIKFRDRNFYLMDPTDFARLMRLGTVKEYREGDLVLAQGEDNPYVGLVLSGQLKVFRDGQLTYLLEESNFLSESGLHAGLLLPGRIEACGSVVADSSARVLFWDRSELVDLMLHNGGIRRSLKAVLSWDIIKKLKAQRILLASGRIEDPEGWTARRNAQTLNRYTGILDNALSQLNWEDRRKQIAKYRSIHHIDDDAHFAALERIGWTPEEFEKGHKDDDPRWKSSSTSMRLRSFLHTTYMRIVGADKDFE